MNTRKPTTPDASARRGQAGSLTVEMALVLPVLLTLLLGIMEIGNILSGAYLNAFYTFTQISMLPSIPALAMDMAGAILNVVLVQLGQMGDQALVMETEFLAEDDGINGHFFLVPDPGSLETLIAAVGVE